MEAKLSGRFAHAITILALCAVGPLAHAQTSFDGTYRGQPTSGNGCSLFTPTLRVEKGNATLRFNQAVTFEGTVGSDGSLDAPHGKSRLSGRFSDGRFQGSASAGRCQYPLDLAR